MTALDAALAYAAQGYAVFPLHTPDTDGACDCPKGKHPDPEERCSNVGKHPRTPRGLDDASTDASIITRWWRMWPAASIGIACGPSGIVVLDVDPRHGGDDSYRDIVAKFGAAAFGTRTALTGGGGEHKVFLSPADVTIRNSAGALGPGLDIRANGGYIVAPPSLHASGRRYEWEDADVPLLPFPDELVAILGASRKQRDASAPGAAIPEGQRNYTLASFAGSMRNRGQSEAAILAALLVTNEEQCSPPLPDGEVRKIAASVGRYEPGRGVTAMTGVDPETGDERSDQRGRLRLHTRDEFLTWPDPTWLVDGLVPQPGAALLYSPSGLGKSFLALDLACCIATGLPWLGHDVVPGDVVYIAAEGQAGFKKRLKAWEDAHGVTTERLYWITDVPQLMSTEDVDTVIGEMMLAVVSPSLIVIDTFARTFVGGEENSAREVGMYLASIERMKAATGGTALVVHHVGHNAPDRPRGSSTIMPAVDLLLALSGDGRTRQLTLTCEKQKDAAEFEPIALRLVLHGDSLIVELSDMRASTTGLPRHAQEALNALRDVGNESVTSSGWMKMIPGMNPRTFYRAKSALLSRSLVENVGSQTRPRWKCDMVTTTDNGATAPSGCDSDMVTRPVGASPLSQSPRQSSV